jgi:GntR family transcriptional regulator
VTGTAGEAAYKTLGRDLRQAILQRRYRDGARLPTEAELARDYRVSRQTVRRAFQDLVADGMVYRVPGRGTFAVPRDGQYLRQFGSIEDLMGLSLDTRMEVLRPLRRQVSVEAASRLRLDSDAVHAIVFRRTRGGEPFCHTAVYLHPVAGAALADLPELGQRGEPLLRVDRIYLTTDGQPVELAVSHFLPEQYSYRVKLRRTSAGAGTRTPPGSHPA